jgi:maltoporin
MTKKTQLIAAIALALATQSAMAALEFGGYLRSGSGSSSKGGGPTCFSLSGDSALATGDIDRAGRLGNECDTYGEIKLGASMGESQGTKFGIHTLMAYGTQQVNDWEQSVPSWREDYATAEGFGTGAFQKATVWVGKRYYNRKDVHIIDTFWLQVTGPGAGIENIDVGIGKFSYANLRSAPAGWPSVANSQGLLQATTAANPTSQMINNDFRLEGINIGAAGSLGLGMNIVNDNSNGAANANGWSAWANQSMVIGTVQNGLILQVAHGEGSLDGGGLNWWGSNKNHDAWRVLDAANFEFGEHINGQAFLGYGVEKFDWFTAEKTSTSIVVRPVYHFDELYSLAVELGHTQVTGNTADIAAGTNHIDKLTIAPQISMGSGFYARPVLRAYYTMANWNQGGAGAYTGRDLGVPVTTFNNSTSGSSYGFQMEAWW